jgi:hypothetical protein
MDGSARFRVNSPAVIGESIDGALLIVNLETGAYFSARGSGDVIWSAIQGGSSVDEVAASLAARFAGDTGAMREEATVFVAQLASEGLIVAGAAPGANPASPATAAERVPFAPPVLEKFTDMQELLVLDPVHEVEEAGWPHARPDLAAAGAPEPA